MGEYAEDALRWWYRRGIPHGRPQKRPPTVVVCRTCGKPDLRWGKITGDRWAVHEKDGKQHICPIAKEPRP